MTNATIRSYGGKQTFLERNFVSRLTDYPAEDIAAICAIGQRLAMLDFFNR
jgi:hypothetical protein